MTPTIRATLLIIPGNLSFPGIVIELINPLKIQNNTYITITHSECINIAKLIGNTINEINIIAL